tara:strand:- start:1014 stop:1403 length:390 start_codon:yes stop_codon:yes gene_type:complete
MQKHKLSNRTFGLAVGTVFLLLSFAIFLLWNTLPITTTVIGAIFIVVGGIFPIALLPINRVWVWGAQYIFLTINFLLLGTVYFVLIMPIGLCMRLFGRDAMEIRKHTNSNSNFHKVKRQCSLENLKNFY